VQINYGTSTAYGLTIENNIAVNASSSTLTGLSENTTYYYRLIPQDVAGNTGAYHAGQFVTQLSSGAVLIVQPAVAIIHFGESLTFTGTVTDSQGYTHNSEIAWYLDSYSMGSINYLPSGDATFTAGTTAGDVKLTAYYSSSHIYPAVIGKSSRYVSVSAIATITIIP
jgi:hypothetical protein